MSAGGFAHLFPNTFPTKEVRKSRKVSGDFAAVHLKRQKGAESEGARAHYQLISWFLTPLGGHNLKQTPVCYSHTLSGAKNAR